MTSRWCRAAVAWVGALLAATLLPAGELSHAVLPGESASAIAQRYYGEADRGGLILLYNGRRATVIHPGETLRIPYCDLHRVRRGDSWSSLTKRYLGQADAWRIVAELNELIPDEPLRVGQELVFPVVIEHRLARGESLALLAERYHGDPSQGRVLQEFNGLDDPRRLAVGAIVRVPLMAPRLRPKPQPEAPPAPEVAEVQEVVEAPIATPPPAPVEPEPRYTSELAAAERAFRAGDYEEAAQALEELRAAVTANGTKEDQRTFWRSLAFVHVAFDRSADACSAWARWGRLGGAPELESDLISPKTRRMLSACPAE